MAVKIHREILKRTDVGDGANFIRGFISAANAYMKRFPNEKVIIDSDERLKIMLENLQKHIDRKHRKRCSASFSDGVKMFLDGIRESGC